MKKILSVIAFTFCLVPAAYSQGFYAIDSIQEIELIFPQSNWDWLLDSLFAAGEEGRLLGTAIINGAQYDSVGVRYKGNSSYSPNRVKNPLNIKLDYVIEDQNIEGYGTLKLSNGFKDPSFVRETMGYEIARKYFPASLSNYAKVTINGEYIGLYTSDQDVDNFFMSTHFSCEDKTRVKGEINGTIPPGQFGVWKYYGTDSTSYFPVFTLESDYGWNELIRFLDTLSNYTAYIENSLNIDRHLWLLAYENLLVNLDSPINNPQNHYLFKDINDRFNPVPWDLNEVFGCFNNLSGFGPLNLYQLQHLDPFVHVTDINFPVLNKILTKPLYQRMYVAHMKTMIAENFSSGWYIARALEIQDIIDDEVLADPNKLYTYSDFLNNLYYTVGGGPPPGNQPIPGITELMEPRIVFLGNQPMFQALQPEIANVQYSPSTVAPGTQVWFTAAVANAASVQLGFCLVPHGRFGKATMYDDGNHNDGLAGDGIYGVSLTAGMTGIDYYIYAENADAAMFSPERAEYEYYSVPVQLDVVINEFMADNVATVPDQDGEYDDWVEFYNNGTTAISLNGFHLTDKSYNLDKWTFPDTVIAAGSYLVVWADEDSSQAGLHANFKLSSLGELLILSDPDTNIIDEITYGPQKADTTTGRYPNGTGPFIVMWPTFGAENINTFPTAVPEPGTCPDIAVLRQNFPNPFSDKTTISFYLPLPSHAILEIRDLSDRRIALLADADLNAGEHSYLWDGGGTGQGVCLCLLTLPDRVLYRKMVIVRQQ